MTYLEELKLTLELKKVIIKNRSLFENDSFDVLKFPEAAKYYKEVGPKLFALFVTCTLDDSE